MSNKKNSLSKFINVGLGEFIYVWGTIYLKEHKLNLYEYIPPHKRDENTKYFLGCFRVVEYYKDRGETYTLPSSIGNDRKNLVKSLNPNDVLKYTSPIFIFHNTKGVEVFIQQLRWVYPDKYWELHPGRRNSSSSTISLPTNFMHMDDADFLMRTCGIDPFGNMVPDGSGVDSTKVKMKKGYF